MDWMKLPARRMGEQPEPARPRMGDGVVRTRLCFNENMYGMAPAVKTAIHAAAERGHQYADFSATALKLKLAECYGLNYGQVVTGAGSSALIDMLGMTFLEAGEEVLYCMPTFGAFRDMAELSGGAPVELPLTGDQRFDLDAMLDAITERTKIIVVCNPNNPSGTYRSEAELRRFIEQVPDRVLVVVDEAYMEFATEPDCVSAVKLLKELPEKPVIVLKTFSKYYAMAGVRVGYALGPEPLMQMMNKCSAAWNVSLMAQEGALAALNAQEYYAETRRQIVETRQWLSEEMEKLGCAVYPSQTNFIYFDAHIAPPELTAALRDRGVLISTFEKSRVSIGTREQCEQFLDALRDVMKGG
ncbi:MAG: histidinol-phosphate transaminase [Clostridia bacterium]|nr:histidinol-phosphate transaminase [Clostridia bacterium]